MERRKVEIRKTGFRHLTDDEKTKGKKGVKTGIYF